MFNIDYKVTRIFVNRNRRFKEEWKNLLLESDIRSEKLIEKTYGIYNENELIATGSLYKNVLKCIAVKESYTGGGVINTLISYLMNEVLYEGYDSIFVYTKEKAKDSFKYLGFKEIESVDDKLIFLEKSINGFDQFIKKLNKNKIKGNRISGIVMNANPFTLGHLYLIEKALSESDVLHVFVVSEDSSEFPSDIRIKLVKDGVSHLENVYIHETSDYIVSSKTFPSYFLDEDENITKIQATLDAKIFKNHIAKALDISRRFVGEEPLSYSTNIYNLALKEVFSDELHLTIIPRKEYSKEVISASRVRKLLSVGDLQKTKKLLPKSTYDFLLTEEANEIINKLIRRRDEYGEV